MYRIARGDLIHVLLCQGELLFASSLPVHSSFRVASLREREEWIDNRTDRDRPELHYADMSALKVGTEFGIDDLEPRPIFSSRNFSEAP
jgi:hypothetical protein